MADEIASGSGAEYEVVGVSENTADCGGATTLFTVIDPLGRSVTCDADTLSIKAGKHGSRFVSESTARDLFEKPFMIARSQHPGQQNYSLYFQVYEGATTSPVKLIRGVVRWSGSTTGDVASIHPRDEIGLTGNIEYVNMKNKKG